DCGQLNILQNYCLGGEVTRVLLLGRTKKTAASRKWDLARAVLADVSFRVVKGSAGPLEITLSSLRTSVQGTVTNEESLPVASVGAVAVPEETKRKQHPRSSLLRLQCGRECMWRSL